MTFNGFTLEEGGMDETRMLQILLSGSFKCGLQFSHFTLAGISGQPNILPFFVKVTLENLPLN